MKNNIIGNPNLRDEKLPVGQSRADLLRKLEEIINSKTSKLNGDVSQSNLNTSETSLETNSTSLFDEDSEKANQSDNDTKVSSIFGEDENETTVSDGSSVSSSNDNSVKGDSTSNNSSAEPFTYNYFAEGARKRYIKEIKEGLRSGISIEESELEEENRN
jgi:hypothetical protein